MRQQNHKLDLVKCMAIYSVVFLHIRLPGAVGEGINCLARFAVPLFFLVSGCFSAGSEPGRLLRRAARTAKLLLGSVAGLAALGCALEAKAGRSPLLYLLELAQPGRWLSLALYQVVPLPYAWHIWFLAALLIVYLLWALLTWTAKRLGRELPYDTLAVAALGLLALHLSLGEGRGLVGLEPVNSLYIRNAWLDGLPFFALGAWMGSRRDFWAKLSPAPLWLGAGVAGLLSLWERQAAGLLDLYLGSALAALLLLAAALNRPQVDSPLLRRTACFCGRELTFYIFALHVPLYGVLLEWREQVFPFAWALDHPWLTPFLVAGASTLLALALYGLNSVLLRSDRNENH